MCSCFQDVRFGRTDQPDMYRVPAAFSADPARSWHQQFCIQEKLPIHVIRRVLESLQDPTTCLAGEELDFRQPLKQLVETLAPVVMLRTPTQHHIAQTARSFAPRQSNMASTLGPKLCSSCHGPLKHVGKRHLCPLRFAQGSRTLWATLSRRQQV